MTLPKKVSLKTLSNEIVLIKQIFKHAHRWGYIKQNPAEYIQRPKMEKRDIKILDPAEAKLLLDNCDQLYRVALLTAILTGVRAGELWALKWKNVDWNSKRFHVLESVWKNRFQTLKTKFSIRGIDLSDDLIDELKKWKLTCPINDPDLMFPSAEGKISCHENVIKRHFEPALRRAGLIHVSFHSLRHTNASMRIQAGQNIKYISTQLGHSSVKVTLDTYGHLFNDTDFNRQQVELLQANFNSVRKPLEDTLFEIEKGVNAFR